MSREDGEGRMRGPLRVSPGTASALQSRSEAHRLDDLTDWASRFALGRGPAAWLAGAIVAVLATFGTLVGGERVPLFRDLLFFFLPFRRYLADQLYAGEIPLWNPWILLGSPFLAAFQTGVFYPPSVWLLIPFPAGFNLFLLFHYVIAVVGAFAYLRHRGLSPAASTIGSLSFALGGYLVSMLNLTNNLQSAAWAPWVMLVWSRHLERPSRRSFVVFVVTVAVQLLAGAPENLLLTLSVVLGWTVTRRAADRRALARAMTTFLLAVLVVVALTAVQILPTCELVAQSVRRSALTFEEVSVWSLSPLSLLQLLLPHSSSFLTPEETGGIGHLLEPVTPWISSLYLGLVPLCLAIAGVVRGRERLFWATVCVVGVLLSLGKNAFLLPVLYELSPSLLGKFRYPEKFYFLVHLGATVLAAEGAQVVLARDRAAERLACVSAMVFVAIAAAISVFQQVDPVGLLWASQVLLGSAEIPFETLVAVASDVVFKAQRLTAVLGLFLLCVLCVRWSILRAGVARVLVVLIVAADLASTHYDLNLSAAWSELEQTAPLVDLAPLRERRLRVFSYRLLSPAREAGAPPKVISGLEQAPSGLGTKNEITATLLALWPAFVANTPMLYGIGTVGGADGIGRSATITLENVLSIVPRDRAVKVLRTFGVAYLVGEGPIEAPSVRLERKGRGERQYVYRVLAPISTAYLVGRLRTAATEKEAYNHMIDPTFLPGEEAVVAETPPRWRDGAAPSGKVRFVVDRSDRIDLAVASDRPAFLVLSDADYPGWRATVDGGPAPIIRTNALVRGVSIPAGRHQVSFRYEPWTFRVGSWISLAFLIGLFAAAIVPPAPRKRPPEE